MNEWDTWRLPEMTEQERRLRIATMLEKIIPSWHIYTSEQKENAIDNAISQINSGFSQEFVELYQNYTEEAENAYDIINEINNTAIEHFI